MIELSSQKLQHIIQPLNILNRNFSFSGVGIDTRLLKRGMLFFALPGEHCHGIEFAKQAEEKGAVALVSDQKSASCNLPQFVVKDPIKALQQLATFWRKQMRQTTCIAVTGSFGKTSVCQMLGFLLNKVGSTYWTNGNFNNELGLPLSILSMHLNYRWAVLEMGARRSGDIAYLCRIFQPHMGIITAIGSTHLEIFGSMQAILETKSELLQALPKSSIAVLPASSRYAWFWRLHFSHLNVQWFDQKKGNRDDYLEQNCVFSWNDFCQHFTWYLAQQKIGISCAYLGEHVLDVLCIVFTALNALHVSPEYLHHHLTHLMQLPGRFQAIKIPQGVIIHDAYNASFESMISGLSTVSSMSADQKIVVLGSMRELGSCSAKQHESIAQSSALEQMDHCFLYGDAFFPYQVKENKWFSNKSDLITCIQNTVHSHLKHVVIYCKASHSLGFDKLVEQLKGHFNETI